MSCVNIVKVECKDEESAARCIAAMQQSGRRDAAACNVVMYEFGLMKGSKTTVLVIERWNQWEDMEKCLTEYVFPVVDQWNELFVEPFDPAKNSTHVSLVEDTKTK